MSHALCRTPEIKREFEALFLPDGSLLFNGIYGRRIHFGKPPGPTRAMLEMCDGRTPVETIFAKLGENCDGAELSAVRRLFFKLTEIGVVAESLRALRPADVPLEVFERFQTEIAAYQLYETPSNSAFDFFRRLRKARVTIIGAGGNGSLAAMMLTAAGVGALHIVDGDFVSESNLVRQIFYTEEQALKQTFKVHALKRSLEALSRFTAVTAEAKFITSAEDVERNIKSSDCLILCADAPRFTINRWVNQACRRTATPYINAFAGLVGPFTVPGESPCFECLERKYSKASGDTLHRGIVAGLQERATFQYPSFVTGVVQIAYLQVNEVINFISRHKGVRTKTGILRAIGGQFNLEEFTEDEICEQCRKDMIHVETV